MTISVFSLNTTQVRKVDEDPAGKRTLCSITNHKTNRRTHFAAEIARFLRPAVIFGTGREQA